MQRILSKRMFSPVNRIVKRSLSSNNEKCHTECRFKKLEDSIRNIREENREFEDNVRESFDSVQMFAVIGIGVGIITFLPVLKIYKMYY